jgi:putative transposase
LEIENEEYENTGKFLYNFDLNKKITEIKQMEEYKWLYDISSITLQRVSLRLSNSIKAFLKNKEKGVGFPRFKSKKYDKESFEIGKVYFIDEKYMKFPKIGKVKYKTHLEFPKGVSDKEPGAKYYNFCVTREIDKWFISFALEENYEYDSQVENSVMHINLSVNEISVTYNDGEDNFVNLSYPNINNSAKMKRLDEKEKYYQKSLARKRNTYSRLKLDIKESNNYMKDLVKLRKTYRRQNGIRTNYTRQIIAELLKMRPSKIIVKNTDINKLKEDKEISDLVQDAKLGYFVEILKYKCEWNDIELITE